MENRGKLKQVGMWGIFVIVTFCAPAIGAFAPPGDWYLTLQKPSWNPPAWVFGPVWTLLYFAMATAAWRVWRKHGWGLPVGWYGIQLVFNAAWTPVFFGAHEIGWALVVILLLWITAMSTTWVFYKADKAAGIMMVPYILWLSFATFLNFTLWQLNS